MGCIIKLKIPLKKNFGSYWNSKKKSAAYFSNSLNLHCIAPIFANWVFLSIKRFKNILLMLSMLFFWMLDFNILYIGNFIKYVAENLNIHILRTLPIFSLVNRVKGFVLINFTLHCVSAPKLVPTMWFLVWWRRGRGGRAWDFRILFDFRLVVSLGTCRRIHNSIDLYPDQQNKCDRTH